MGDAIQFTTPFQAFYEDNGNPLEEGKLAFFEAGTSNPVNTYSDPARTIANTNPIILDSGGRTPNLVYMDPGEYKITLSEDNDDLIWTADNYTITEPTDAAGPGLEIDNGVLQTAIEINSQTGTTYTVLNTDRAKLVTHSNVNPIAVTLPEANGTFAPANWYYYTQNLGTNIVRITPTVSNIDGVASLVLFPGEGVLIVSTGTNYVSQKGKMPAVFVKNITSATYTVLNSDRATLLSIDEATPVAVTLPEATVTFAPPGWYTYFQNINEGLVTITPTNSTIDGVSELLLERFEGVMVASNGTDYFTMRGASAFGAGSGIVGQSLKSVGLNLDPVFSGGNSIDYGIDSINVTVDSGDTVGVWVDGQSFVVDPQDGNNNIVFIFNDNISAVGNSGNVGEIRLNQDGVTIATQSITIPNPGGSASTSLRCGLLLNTPPSASPVTYQIQGRRNSGFISTVNGSYQVLWYLMAGN